MLTAIWHVLLELAPWLLLGTAVAGLLHVLLPKSLVRKQLRGRWAPAKAVAVGVPMPLCSCGVIPAGLGLKRDGASNGAAIGFLISTPQTGVDSILVSASFLGWPFALFKVASAALTGVVGGWLTDRWAPDEAADPMDETSEADTAPSRSLRAMWDHGLELLESIWRWLAIGVVVSAAIELFVPEQTLAGFAALGSLGAALVVLLLSLPLYVCATASVPIAAALVANGMPTGAALVFLMAGPATNVATVGAVYRGFGLRAAGIYLATVTVGSVGLGVLFDSVLSSESVKVATHQHSAAWWAVASALVLLALIAYFSWRDLRGLWLRLESKRRAAGATHELGVRGLTCNRCVDRLETALLETDGVTAAEVSLEREQAVVRGAIDDARIREVIRRAGYQPG